MAKFEDCIGFVLRNEGGYSDLPEDHGGPTNFGITQNTLSVMRGRDVSADDVKSLMVEEAEAYYQKFYWAHACLDQIESTLVATAILDTAVNRGIRRAIQYAQLAVYEMGRPVLVDGFMGPETTQAINHFHPQEFIKVFSNILEHGYKNITKHDPMQAVFLTGWLNRVERIRALS